MKQRLELTVKGHVKDVAGDHLRERIISELGLKLGCKFIDAYNIEQECSEEEMLALAKDVFSDKVSQQYSINEPLFRNTWRIEVGMLPGVTDNIGKTASEAIMDRLGSNFEVFYSRVYSFNGDVDEVVCEQIADLIHNPLVEKYRIYPPGSDTEAYLPKVKIIHEPNVERISLHMSKARFDSLSKEKLLSLNYEEFLAIKKYFKSERIIAARKKVGLDTKITDVELEALAQTWSEHCKHKIFNAHISYDEEGETHAINSLFKTFIAGATEQVKKPYVVSIFKDNGGIIKFNHEFDIAVKVETHNAPSALDPYGGALTGILGVQRDIMGTGLGANPIANIDVLCFGPLDTPKDELPKSVLHPKVIYEGVVLGIEHGGNKMGIPTVNGSIVFEKDYSCRPLVYAGTIGILPTQINGRRTSEKIIEPGYLAVVLGGRVGKDGIHGATFSSMQIDQNVPQSVVQIGDPITQKKTLDCIIEARDKRLFEAITDNGAGGLSSSIGEMAEFSNGCEIYLDKCPLKYSGLDPWEILISESQERMSIAVPPEKLDELMEVAKTHGVEASVLGKFTNSKKFHVLFDGKTVAYLDLKFLHHGLPQMKLKASWKKLIYPEPNVSSYNPTDILFKLLSSPNITTKEDVIRRFDHEVKGSSVIKPIMLGPSDAGVIRPLFNSNEGLVISHGICPRYVQDGYTMATMAFDEALRNAIAAGARFGYLACLDNFSWPDPIKSSKTTDGEQKLGSLVRACLGMYDCATHFNIPIISGKDSMKNDYYSGSRKYSIPPTLLVTIVGKINNIKNAMSSEFKLPGDYIYVLGTTKNELGGSEFYKLFGGVGNNPPELNWDEHVQTYKALSAAIEDGVVASAHDISDGGMAVAFAESALGIGLGAELDTDLMPSLTNKTDALLFGESPGRFIVSVHPENISKFEYIMGKSVFKKVGRVRGDSRFIIKTGSEGLVNENIENVKEAYWKGV
ncbi:phosphoribosylformylglycinamidine synthase subunit PurL [Candidatus Micrarchaeota archaeon]|nr:phosphoribosylformylglycinamidine synthase subunit PurL [Candidatus Micrarchaeota archaeon]